jgi:hypothetical protein
LFLTLNSAIVPDTSSARRMNMPDSEPNQHFSDFQKK